MILSEIIEELDKIAPREMALDWDNSGLLVGESDSEIKKILIALDCDDAVVKEAKRVGADLIITHHPLIFSPLKSVTTSDFIGKRVVRLIQNNISLFAMHTNFDVNVMAGLAAEKMGLSDTRCLEKTYTSEAGEELGIGVTGDIFAVNLKELSEKVKEAFDREHVVVYGKLDKLISRVSICPGSGKSTIKYAISEGADVLITGDIDHHSGIDAVANKLAIIDAGHYGIEQIFIDYMKKTLDEVLADKDIEILVQQRKEPFVII